MVILNRRNFLKSIGGTLLATAALGLPIRGQALPKLTISLPPQIESFPIAFADDQGIFADHGLDVDLVGFANMQDRNNALITGAIDGVMSDISSILILLGDETPLTITGTAYKNEDGSRRYVVMTHFFSNIETLDQLLARLGNSTRDTIGLIRRTDMEYETDRLLAAKKFVLNESKHYTEFRDMVELATLLAAGSWLAAVLPEPIAAYVQYITDASDTPVKVLSAYEEQDLVPSILAFQKQVITDKPDRIEKFYAGFRDVIDVLRTTPRDQIVEVGVDAALAFFFPGVSRADLPPGAEDFLKEYLIPQFPVPRDLKPEEYQQVADWGVSKRFLSSGIPFEIAYSSQFNNNQS